MLKLKTMRILAHRLYVRPCDFFLGADDHIFYVLNWKNPIKAFMDRHFVVQTGHFLDLY